MYTETSFKGYHLNYFIKKLKSTIQKIEPGLG